MNSKIRLRVFRIFWDDKKKSIILAKQLNISQTEIRKNRKKMKTALFEGTLQKKPFSFFGKSYKIKNLVMLYQKTINIFYYFQHLKLIADDAT